MSFFSRETAVFPLESSASPVKLFKIQVRTCSLVHSLSHLSCVFLEFAHIHGVCGLPTVNCFVPSLAPGTPFQISIHSWNTPTISQFTKSYSKHVNDVKFETRLFIDGRLVAYVVPSLAWVAPVLTTPSSTSLNRQCDWPHVIANGYGNESRIHLEVTY